jgi:hypothetical protein
LYERLGGGSAVEREELAVGAALVEPLISAGIADDVVRVEGKLAIGEAALEVLQAVPAVMPPPRLSGVPDSSPMAIISANRFFIGEESRWWSAVPPR